jgi:two-component system response regulator
MNKQALFNVLLVEDNPDDSELTLHALKEGNRDIKTLHLKDGVEALDFIFAKNSFENGDIQDSLEFVLLDLKLPRLDGLGVLQKIRADKRTKMLPVIILSSSAQQCDIIAAYDLSVNSYVVKPIAFEDFVKSVKTLSFYWSRVNESLYSANYKTKSNGKRGIAN